MNVLVVEDDERIVAFLQRGLQAEGYTVDVARSGPDGLVMGQDDLFSAIILDILLPGLTGRDVCQELRSMGIRTPVMMLTALDSLEDKVLGLRLGADDYMTKPFAFDELVARLEALIRRAADKPAKEKRLRVADLTLDRERFEVFRAGQKIALTAKEMALLEYMMVNAGKVVSRTRILETVWGYNADPLTNVVDVYIRRLRSKVDDNRPTALIRTIRGLGYKIEAPGPDGH